MLIYTPRGKAREYSPLALNLYSGCDHGCTYCYVPRILRKSYDEHIHVKERTSIIDVLEKELSKQTPKQQVLLSFTGDVYCHFAVKSGITRQAIQLLLQHQVPVAILTKGGGRCLTDLDLFKRFSNIKVGATLTIPDDRKLLSVEPKAASYTDRIQTLQRLHDEGIKTWVSLEPILDTDSPMTIIKDTYQFVDEYKLGAISGNPDILKAVGWQKIINEAVPFLRKNRKKFYVKNDLAKLVDYKFRATERDMDFLTEKRDNGQEVLFSGIQDFNNDN